MFRTHIMWGDYPETEDLIKELQQDDCLAIITVIDVEAKQKFVKKQGEVTNASSNCVEDARLPQVIEFHYYYIPPSQRIDSVPFTVLY